MAIDRWFIGGGAEHSPESVRRAMYAATSGVEGISTGGGLKVVPLAVPGQGVRVLIGSALMNSRYVGGETQTYMGTVYTQETVAITPTGSGSGRSDLVVMRVEDPFAAGSPYSSPASGDISTAPYIYIRVIPGVPAGTTRLQNVPGHQNDTGLTLARIDLPPSTGTVTDAIIKDLRAVSAPRSLRLLKTRSLSDDEESKLTVTSSEGQVWAGIPVDLWGPIDIPEWATHVQVTVRWNGILFRGNIWGDTWLRLGEAGSPHRIISTRFDSISGDTNRSGTEAVGTIAIPAEFRGTQQRFYPMGRRDPGTPAASSATMDKNSSMVLDIEFSERPA